MKKILLFVVAVIIVSQLSAQSAKRNKLFPFKCAVIEYQYTGNTTGTETFYVDDYGMKQCRIKKLTTKTWGMTSKENKMEIFKNFDIYAWEIGAKEGGIMHNSIAEGVMNDRSLTDDQVTDGVTASLGLKKKGKETVDGKVCNVWEGSGMKIWEWNGVNLRSNSKIMGITMNIEAVSVKIDQGVPAGVFDIPSNVKFTRMEDMFAGEGVTDGDGDAESKAAQDSAMKSIKSGIKGLFGK